MASDKNNINELVNDDDDPTADLRLPNFDRDVKAATGTADHGVADELQQARQRIDQLNLELDQQSDSNARLRKELDEIRRKHAEEIRMIRFELGEAQETSTQHELIAKQLASDLIETRGHRIELENMLNDSEEQSKERIEELERANRKYRRKAADLEEQIGTKGEAINCLLTELAKKERQFESENEVGYAIEAIDASVAEDYVFQRARMARVLIGSVEGRELRFPLFKDRLTIGRTEQNDIQLKADYISRRHAVIVIDGGVTRLIDWGSKNGVYVNSKRITERFLNNGDIVGIGTAKFRYEELPKRDS